MARFSSELAHHVSESTVRNMKKTYLSKLSEERNPDKITSLPHAARGRPLMLGSYDRDVASYMQSLRIAGGIVNHSIVVAAAKGIVYHKNPALMKEHGGPIDIKHSWAESFSLLKRLCKA